MRAKLFLLLVIATAGMVPGVARAEAGFAPFLRMWGGAGSAPGSFKSPDMVTVDLRGDVFVADRENDRVQKFDYLGHSLAVIGRAGGAPGQMRGPRGVAVDGLGDPFLLAHALVTLATPSRAYRASLDERLRFMDRAMEIAARHQDPVLMASDRSLQQQFRRRRPRLRRCSRADLFELGEVLGENRLLAAIGGAIVMLVDAQVLLGHVTLGIIMGVFVTPAVAHVFHEFRRGIADVQGHR